MSVASVSLVSAARRASSVVVGDVGAAAREDRRGRRRRSSTRRASVGRLGAGLARRGSRCSSFSTIAATAPESARIQAICGRRRRLVDRHGRRADPPDRVVGDGPLVARLGQQRDPVAGRRRRRRSGPWRRRARRGGTRRASRRSRRRRPRGRSADVVGMFGEAVEDVVAEVAQIGHRGLSHLRTLLSGRSRPGGRADAARAVPARLSTRPATSMGPHGERTRRVDGADDQRHRDRGAGRPHHGRHRRLRGLSGLGDRGEDGRRRAARPPRVAPSRSASCWTPHRSATSTSCATSGTAIDRLVEPRARGDADLDGRRLRARARRRRPAPG